MSVRQRESGAFHGIAHVRAAAGQQAFIRGARARCYSHGTTFFSALPLAARVMDLSGYRLNLVILRQRKDNRRGLRGAGFIKQRFVGFEQR